MLLPERHPVKDFFVLDVMDVVPKSDMGSMEHPIFSLSTKPERRMLTYEHGDNSIKIMPSYAGLPTVFDKDLLIYCISHLVHRRNQGETISRQVRITTHDFLITTNRDTGGIAYERLETALQRLKGTVFETTIKTGDTVQVDGFGLIDSYSYARKGNMWKPAERLEYLEIVLSEWLYRAVESLEVLALNRDYFRIRSPLDRRLYELARKHCGSGQAAWRIGIDKLQLKTGSKSAAKEFARHMRLVVAADDLPDYAVTLENDGALVVFHRRGKMMKPRFTNLTADRLEFLIPEAAMADARQAARERGWDFQVLKQQFIGFMEAKGRPNNMAAAFIGFIKNKSKV
jgi:plasmid replication initiation protein